MKTVNNTSAEQAKQQVSDIQFFGNGDTFQLISKASSKSQGWMKSCKAMEIKGIGCVVQVTTEFRDKSGEVSNCAEALTFVPNVEIALNSKGDKCLTQI